MMTADISALTGLQAGEPLDLEMYVDAKESAPPPSKGEYILRASAKPVFSATRENFLSAQIDPTILGPTSAGIEVRFQRVSAKPFKRGTATVSQLGDYLRSVLGTRVPRVTTPQEQADAVEATAGQVFKAILDWEAYDKDTNTRVKGMERFPKLPDGTHSPWIELAGTDDGTGKPRKMRANVRIERFIPAS